MKVCIIANIVVACSALSINVSAATPSDSVSFDKNSSYRYTGERFKHKRQRVRSVPVTGPNRFCGQLRWSFEDQDAEFLGFRQMGVHVPGATKSIALDEYNCTDDILLATFHDTSLSNDPPGPQGPAVQVPDERLENILLRDVPKVPSALEGGTSGVRQMIPRQQDVDGAQTLAYQSRPNNDITLGDWLRARGVLDYRCNAQGGANITVRYRNLLPNGVYTMWGVWRDITEDGARRAYPVPFGGVPNVVVPDSRGNAVLSRRVNFCPSEETDQGQLLLFVVLAYHSDAMVYGAVPEADGLLTQFIDADGQEFESTLSRLMHHDQLAFPINITSSLIDE